ncbi:hypothetical protein [Allopusillimonas ginsengisoli]|uniref:hypothetical protein n=1 Tax=Allopusillimonas ginsengisoli TaxID=453575 RepID=UPI00101FB5A5|nr:hypothetical protein [Allopusillimonas ginsengisoli]TEA79242.1 hypothetical protein ERE07_07655 [Allopusillimonas ginsengisoli]
MYDYAKTIEKEDTFRSAGAMAMFKLAPAWIDFYFGIYCRQHRRRSSPKLERQQWVAFSLS